ncbi:ASCH domain-containing protein [Halobacillus shinanisalinarum]|uniref:ASCH domain-containing protein n=1 Tax=Halobacillus shinanisalinarum TaxID=2932258 RepID=A0ABY4GUB0_9BACI|nr:ASCH domain-containing protein [Halobacillus shinanisalinarum]UOQ91752.1 ASCH domain-containing protein [Halobacillus shinanisalinarum]
MEHAMKLYENPFRLMREGKKHVEVRLNDEKRRKVKIGDVIEFRSLSESSSTMRTEVINLQSYPTFQEMYEHIPSEDLGVEALSLEEMVNSTYEIYTPEQEKQWGALAISIQPLR